MERMKYVTETKTEPIAVIRPDYQTTLRGYISGDVFTQLRHVSEQFKQDLFFFFDNKSVEGKWIGIDLSNVNERIELNNSQLDSPFLIISKSNCFITQMPNKLSELPSDFAIRLLLLSEYFNENKYSVFTYTELLDLMSTLSVVKNSFEIPFKRYTGNNTREEVVTNLLNITPHDHQTVVDKTIGHFNMLQKIRDYGGNCIVPFVRDIGNVRVGVLYDRDGYVDLVVVPQISELYDIMDIGRVRIGSHYLDDTISQDYIINNYSKLCDVINDNLPMVVGMQHIKTAMRIAGIEEARVKREQAISAEHTAKFNAMYSVIRTHEYIETANPKEYVFNDIHYKGKLITYNDMLLWCDNESVMYSVYYNININLDFNDLFDCMLNRVSGAYVDKPVYLKFGSTKANNIRTLMYTTKRTDRTTKCYINGVRINKGEIKECLRNSMCFTDDKQYLHFLKQVSKMSLELHKVTADGLIFNNLKGDFGAEACKIVVIRNKDRKTFIEYKDDEGVTCTVSVVKPLRKLINQSHIKWDNLQYTSTLNNLLRKVTNLDDVKCNEIIKYGKKLLEHETIQQREALEREIKELDLERKKIVLDGTESETVIVKGKSGKQYAIRISDAKVFHYPELRYICIADTENTTNWGKVLNRVYALKNDSVMAGKHISTLSV